MHSGTSPLSFTSRWKPGNSDCDPRSTANMYFEFQSKNTYLLCLVRIGRALSVWFVWIESCSAERRRWKWVSWSLVPRHSFHSLHEGQSTSRVWRGHVWKRRWRREEETHKPGRRCSSRHGWLSATRLVSRLDSCKPTLLVESTRRINNRVKKSKPGGASELWC